MKRKILSIVILAALLVGLMPVPTHASEDSAAKLVSELKNSSSDRAAVTGENTEYLTNPDEAVQLLRSGMVNRQDTITVRLATETYDETLGSGLMDQALAHTGVPTEGDYLQFHLAGYEIDLTSYAAGDQFYNEFTYRVWYYTNAEQEAAVTAQVEQLLGELKPSGSDYTRIKTIYDWICSNIVYDHDRLEDDSYNLKYSAYAALINRTAVCQGYALLLYRLALELGIDCRIISGISHDESHAWNIVSINGQYYNLDATWDAELEEYQYFLKCEANFVDHTRNEQYLAEDFVSSYPIADVDYFAGFEMIREGDFEYSLFENVATLVKYHGNAEVVTVPSKVDRYPVHAIGSLTFDGNQTVKSIIISEGIRSIDHDWAFQCPALESFSLPTTLGMGDELSSGVITGLAPLPRMCENVRLVTVPDSSPYLTVVDGILYSKDMTNLIYLPPALPCTVLEIPEGVTSIGSSSCSDAKYLEQVIMPDTVEYIGYWAFQNATKLRKINISENCTMIGQYAFSGTDLKTLHIPASLTYFMEPFSAINELKEITVDPKNPVYSIRNGALYSHGGERLVFCVKDPDVTRYKIAEGTKEIAWDAFANNRYLTEIFVPEGVTNIEEYAFVGCLNLQKINLPEGITRIEKNLFAMCGNLTQVNIPDSVTIIEEIAFSCCAKLKTIEIPAGVTEIGSIAFEYCASLDVIIFKGDAPKISEDAFYCTEATAFYPLDNPTWTEDKLQDYSGTITWVPYAPADNEHAYEVVVTEPTCHSQGYTTHTCSVCGDRYVDNYVDPVPHNYNKNKTSCEWCGLEALANFTSYTCSLGGNISVNFYVNVTEELLNNPEAYVLYQYAGLTVKQPISAGQHQSGSEYKFSCPVNSKQMTEPITAQFFVGETPVSRVLTKSVADYANYLVQNSKSEKVVNLMTAMLNYGAASQTYFKYRAYDLANSQLSKADRDLGTVDATAYAHKKIGELHGIKLTGATLMLDSETTIRIYFQPEEGKSIDDFTFTVDGQPATPIYHNGEYYISVPNISAHRLDDMHVFTCGDFEVHYSGLSYVNQLLKSYLSNPEYDLARALYRYSEAAEAYLAS